MNSISEHISRKHHQYNNLSIIRVYFLTPLYEVNTTQGQFLSGGLTGLNSEFSFSLAGCHTKSKEPSLLYYLPITGGRMVGFIPFPRVLVLCEMQTALSRI